VADQRVQNVAVDVVEVAVGRKIGVRRRALRLARGNGFVLLLKTARQRGEQRQLFLRVGAQAGHFRAARPNFSGQGFRLRHGAVEMQRQQVQAVVLREAIDVLAQLARLPVKIVGRAGVKALSQRRDKVGREEGFGGERRFFVGGAI
jgi:hypothetical protein